ncbi:MAG: (d)CMP kinase [Clostridia bacterium]
MLYTIAIDGPVGAGKSSVAEEVARRLHILHLDTGAMYRAFAWQAQKEGISATDEKALCSLAERVLPEVRYVEEQQHTLIDGTDVTALIRTPEISMMTSTLSKAAGVRRVMVERQQALAKQQSMLLDGRDIGTKVLPNATLKIYLTASAEVRAARRFAELQAKGDPSTLEEVLADVIRRDEQDMTRKIDPLRPAKDAQLLDTSELTQEQVVCDILRRISIKLGKMPKPEEKLTIAYRMARVLAHFLFTTVMPVTYHNVENAQLDAPYILIANHSSMIDPLAAGWKCSRYQLRFLGKKELIENPITRWLFKHMRMIPVDRHNMDMSAVRTCLKTLKQGHSLAIFPEGTRYKQGLMENLESGIAMIALRSGVKILPAYIVGEARLFKRMHVYYGQPISLREIAKKETNKAACDEVLALITQTYRDMHQKAMET